MGIMVYSLLWVVQDFYHQPTFLRGISALVSPPAWSLAWRQKTSTTPEEVYTDPCHVSYFLMFSNGNPSYTFGTWVVTDNGFCRLVFWESTWQLSKLGFL